MIKKRVLVRSDEKNIREIFDLRQTERLSDFDIFMRDKLARLGKSIEYQRVPIQTSNSNTGVRSDKSLSRYLTLSQMSHLEQDSVESTPLINNISERLIRHKLVSSRSSMMTDVNRTLSNLSKKFQQTNDNSKHTESKGMSFRRSRKHFLDQSLSPDSRPNAATASTEPADRLLTEEK